MKAVIGHELEEARRSQKEPVSAIGSALLGKIGIQRFNHAKEQRADQIAYRTEGGAEALMEALEIMQERNAMLKGRLQPLVGLGLDFAEQNITSLPLLQKKSSTEDAPELNRVGRFVARRVEKAREKMANGEGVTKVAPKTHPLLEKRQQLAQEFTEEKDAWVSKHEALADAIDEARAGKRWQNRDLSNGKNSPREI